MYLGAVKLIPLGLYILSPSLPLCDLNFSPFVHQFQVYALIFEQQGYQS